MMIRDGMLETIHRWDVNTFQRITTWWPQGTLVKLARLVSRTGDGWAYPLVPLVLYLLGLPGVEQFFYIAAAAFAIERTIYPVAKKSFKRRRPYNIVPDFTSHIIASDEFSFPSGHTSAAFLMITALVLCFGPGFALLYLWAGAVGASRVILGVHFPTDILVGAALGSAIATTIYMVAGTA
ncbi:MAG: phosphatase PAP2 family protein [Pseudomonadota bacterium]